MAKKFNQVYKVAKETAYAKESLSLLVAASMNSTVDFSPVLAPNGTVDAGATTAEYNVQRIKRIKAKDISNPNTGTTSDALAALDTFSKVDWASAGIATGKLRGVGVKVGINEKFDIDSMGEGHAKAVSDSVAIQAVERQEALLDEVITNAGSKTAVKLTYTAGKTDIFDALTDKVSEIQLLSDDFKAMTDSQNMLIVIHPLVRDAIVKEIGVVFNQEAAIYKTGLKSKFSINGIPVIVDMNLNKFQGAAATESIGAIVMDIESVAFKAANETKPVSVDLGLTKYNGVYFYNIQKVVDASRIATFEVTTKAITKKASA